jgi:hypothetical protein
LQRAQADLAVALTTGDEHAAGWARARVAESRRSLGGLPDRPPVSGRVVGTVAVALGVVGLVVPVAGLAAAVVAVAGIVRARVAGAPASTRLWWGLGLGLLALLGLALLVPAGSTLPGV